MRRTFLVFSVALAALVFQQWRGDVYSADFDATGGDEAAHFVTGLMIRDYAAGALGSSPVQFAERFYLSYPKVAFGIWPPLFHLLEGLWFLVCGPSRFTALLLVALLAAGVAALLHRESASRYGSGWAAISLAVFLLLPLTVDATAFFGADTLVSLLMFGAAVAWSRYLGSHGVRDSAAFGVLASLALLTKYNALSLALLPPLSLALSGQWKLLARRSFWLPVPIVAALAGPWYYLSWNMVRYAADMGTESVTVWEATTGNAAALGRGLGLGLLVIAFTAAAVRSRAASTGPRPEASMAALIASLFVFHSLLFPYVQERYLLPAAPAAMLLAASWFSWKAAGPRWSWTPAVAALAIAGFLLHSTISTPKAAPGLAELAAALKPSAGSSDPQRLLISSSGGGEGAFIAEVALREPRPRSIVFRSSKLFARSTWMHRDYTLVCSNPEEVEARLDELRIDRIVIDHDTRPQKPHQTLLAQTVASQPSRWKIETTVFRTTPQGRRRIVRLYRRNAPYLQPERAVELDMGFTLGRRLKLTSSAAALVQDRPLVR